MNKKTFLKRLKRALRGCPAEEIQSRLAFYAEMIDDRVEEGLSEEDAVSQIGRPEAIADEILSEASAGAKKERRPMGAGAMVLIALGSPIWLSLLVAAGAVVVSVFACMFAVLISLYAVLASVGVSALGGLVFGIACALDGSFLLSLLWLGLSFVCAGLTIVIGLVCVPIGKGILGAVVSVWRFVLRTVFKRRVLA